MIRSIPTCLSMPALTLATILVSTVAHADTSPDTVRTGYTTVGACVTPEYEGSSDLKWIPYVAAEIRSGHRYAALEGLTARVNLLDLANYELGPAASVTLRRDRKVDNLAVSRLPELDASFELGAFFARSFFDVAGNGDSLRLVVQAVRDVADVQDGWRATASLSYGRAVGERLAVRMDLSATYASGKYAQTYFGLSPAAAGTSGLQTYEAAAGLKDVALGLVASYANGKNWSIDAFAGYRRLVGDAADSPIVTRGGDANQIAEGLGVGKRFQQDKIQFHADLVRRGL